jgi:hypothetical protein
MKAPYHIQPPALHTHACMPAHQPSTASTPPQASRLLRHSNTMGARSGLSLFTVASTPDMPGVKLSSMSSCATPCALQVT